MKKHILVWALILSMAMLMFTSINTRGSVQGVYWDNESGRDINSNETMIFNTELYNSNNYKVTVTFSIKNNYTMNMDDDTFVSPCPDGTWIGKLNETTIMLDPKEVKNVPIVITSPRGVRHNDVYGLNISMHVNNYIVPKHENEGDFIFCVIVNLEELNNDILPENNKEDFGEVPPENKEEKNNLLNSPSNQKTVNSESDNNIIFYDPGIVILFCIVIAVIIIYSYFLEK